MQSSRSYRISFLSVCLSLGLLLVLNTIVACDPPITFKVENRTDETLYIYIWNSPRGTVSPGETVEMVTPPGTTIYPFKAKNKQGEVLYSDNFTSYGLERSTIIVKPPK